jgi:hypothetical protein
VFAAPLFEEGMFCTDIELGELRRERITLPLLRDERPELLGRELRRIIATRAGINPDALDAGDGPDRVDRPDLPGGGPLGEASPAGGARGASTRVGRAGGARVSGA